MGWGGELERDQPREARWRAPDIRDVRDWCRSGHGLTWRAPCEALQKFLLPSPPFLPLVRMALIWFCFSVYTIVCDSFLWDHTRCSPREISDWFIVFDLWSTYSVDSHYVLFFLVFNVSPTLLLRWLWSPWDIDPWLTLISFQYEEFA